MQYEIATTASFDTWFDNLRDQKAAAAISRNIIKLSGGLFGNVKSLGGGLNELKVDVGAGYRVYFVTRGSVLIVLLIGGDKSTQKFDMKQAKGLADHLD